MKLSHIIGIIIIVVAIGVIVSTTKDVSTYVNFTEASNLAVKGNSSEVHVVGKLKKNVDGKIIGMEYQPQIDPNFFSFILVDNKNQEKRIIYHEPKPQDFETAEQIVIIGKADGENFKASKILMKCPSKYQDNKVQVPQQKQARL